MSKKNLKKRTGNNCVENSKYVFCFPHLESLLLCFCIEN